MLERFQRGLEHLIQSLTLPMRFSYLLGQPPNKGLIGVLYPIDLMSHDLRTRGIWIRSHKLRIKVSSTSRSLKKLFPVKP